MSSLSNLAPLPVKKAYTSNQTLDTSVDDFDALLDDMLDSPKVKRPGKTNSQKNKSSKQGLSKKDDFPSSSKTDVKDNVDQTLQKSGPKTSGKDNSKDYMYDSDELSVDNESGLLTSFTANDDLEDSILGGLLKGNKNTVKKASAFGNKVPLTSNIKTNVISSSSAATTKKTETVQSPIDSYSDGGYEFSDDESKDDKKKGSSILAAKKDVGPSSVGVVLAKQVLYMFCDRHPGVHLISDSAFCGRNLTPRSKQKTTSSNIASDEPEPFDISDDEDEEEEESAYRPTVGVKRSVPVVSPHRPSTSLPSSSLSHTAGGSFASSSAVSTAGSRKVFDGSDRAGASGGGTGSLPAETDMFQPKESEEVDIGFVPSFLEPGRQPRQKRYSTSTLCASFCYTVGSNLCEPFIPITSCS